MTRPGSPLTDLMPALAALTAAVDHLDDVVTTTRLFADPTGVGDHLTCAEADAFAGLLSACGLDTHARDLLEQHATSDTDPDDRHHYPREEPMARNTHHLVPRYRTLGGNTVGVVACQYCGVPAAQLGPDASQFACPKFPR